MRGHIAFDAGGTKLRALLFGDDGRPLADATAGGANVSSAGRALAERNIELCVEALLRKAPAAVDEIGALYGWFMTEKPLYLAAVQKRLPCGGPHELSEGALGMYACGVEGDAVCALSGTGSNTFYIKNGETVEMLGGWGALLGDEGSGCDIGRQLVRGAVAFEGRYGPATGLEGALLERYEAEDMRGVVNRIYDTPSPVAELAALVPLAARFAQAGNPFALGLFRGAGEQLGAQVGRIVAKNHIPEGTPLCIIGGAFKAHALLAVSLEAFVKERLGRYPLHRPIFSPVVGAVVCHLRGRRGGIRPEDIARLKTLYPGDLI